MSSAIPHPRCPRFSLRPINKPSLVWKLLTALYRRVRETQTTFYAVRDRSQPLEADERAPSRCATSAPRCTLGHILYIQHDPVGWGTFAPSAGLSYRDVTLTAKRCPKMKNCVKLQIETPPGEPSTKSLSLLLCIRGVRQNPTGLYQSHTRPLVYSLVSPQLCALSNLNTVPY